MDFRNHSESVFHSLRCGFSGLKLIFTPGLRRYVAVPILLNLVLFGAAFWLAGTYFEAFMERLIPNWLDWLRWLLWPLFGISLILIAVFSFSLVANILGSFFYAKLAQKVESQILGNLPDIEDEPRDISWVNGLSSEFGRLLYYFSRAVPLLLLFLIPGVNLVAPFLWIGFSAWFLAMEFMAYSLDEAGFLFSDQRRMMRPYRIHVTVFGGLILFGLAIPVLNLVVPPAAVIGGTLYIGDKKKKRSESVPRKSIS